MSYESGQESFPHPFFSRKKADACASAILFTLPRSYWLRNWDHNRTCEPLSTAEKEMAINGYSNALDIK